MWDRFSDFKSNMLHIGIVQNWDQFQIKAPIKHL